jgi:hypothetical protein
MESRVPGLSLAAQPAALTMAVSFTESVKPHLPVLRIDYNHEQEIGAGIAPTVGLRNHRKKQERREKHQVHDALQHGRPAGAQGQ